MPASPMPPRTIAKPRIIAALMAEIDAADASVMAQFSGFSVSTKFSCEIKVPFENTKIKLLDASVDDGPLDCTVLFAGQRIRFMLPPANDEALRPLPDTVEILDLRSSKRRKFSPGVVSAEIFTKRGVIMGVPLDLSHRTLAIIAATDGFDLIKGDSVRVRIIGDATSPDIFFAEMQVHSVDTSRGNPRLLLQDSSSPRKPKRHTPRIPTVGTLSIVPQDNSLGGSVTLNLLNASMTGVAGSTGGEASAPWLLPGNQVQIAGVDLGATVVWANDGEIGLKVNGLDDAGNLGRWVRLLAQWRRESGVLVSEMEEFAGLLVQAGFLKGARRRVFGHSVTKFLPPERMTQNPLLYIRQTLKNSKGELYGHVSLSRLTDDAWIMQEGVHRGDSGPDLSGFEAMLMALTRRAKELKIASASAPRYLLWFWDSKVESTEKAAKPFLNQPENQLFKARHFSLKALEAKLPPKPSANIINLQMTMASDRSQIFQSFAPTLIEAFGGRDGEHSCLNAALVANGHGHWAKTIGIADEGGVWGLAYRLTSYYTLNVSGVLNSTFLIVHHDTSADRLLHGLARLAADPFTFGTDDVAIVFGQEPNPKSSLAEFIENAKPYNLMAVDVLLNLIYTAEEVPS